MNENFDCKFNVISSIEVFRIYKEILLGNNTYLTLVKKTKKQRPQIVELVQPLLKKALVIKKPFTGTRGNPVELIPSKNGLHELIFNHVKENNNKKISDEEINQKINKFLENKNNILESKNFAELMTKFSEFSLIVLYAFDRFI